MATVAAAVYETPIPTLKNGSPSAEAVGAWHDCQFRKLLGRHADEMLLDTVETRSLAGAELHLTDGPPNRLLALIVDGSARVYTTSAQGRQATVRYVGRGDVVGLATLLAPAAIDDGDALAFQALSACHVLRLSTRRFRELVTRNPETMWGLCSELACTLMSSHHMLADNVFQPVRSRVARHLLDMAKFHDGRLTVQASPQDIADAIGSVREVVSRTTGRLREEGIIRRDGMTHVILDPRMLQLVAAAA